MNSSVDQVSLQKVGVIWFNDAINLILVQQIQQSEISYNQLFFFIEHAFVIRFEIELFLFSLDWCLHEVYASKASQQLELRKSFRGPTRR